MMQKYLHKFTHLRRDNKFGGAPHKPILLLSIIESVETKIISDNKIYISSELVSVYKSIWSNFVKSEKHHCIFAMPFYHLKTSGFWKLIPKRGFENAIQSKVAMKTFSNLNEAVDYVQIDDTLYDLLKDNKTREVLKDVIIEKYFSSSITKNFSESVPNYLDNIKYDILNDSSEIYKTKMVQLQNNLLSDSFEEEKFVRGGVFKKQIPLLYRNSCAISELQITTNLNLTLIDACHIVPFNASYDDTITNGISLSPTLHRAFDRGLISIDNDYKVIVSNMFIESGESFYSLKQFAGKKILLPENNKYYPNEDNLIWHRENIFKD